MIDILLLAHSPKLELIWTLSPKYNFVFKLLYRLFLYFSSVDEPIDPLISTKVIGLPMVLEL